LLGVDERDGGPPDKEEHQLIAGDAHRRNVVEWGVNHNRSASIDSRVLFARENVLFAARGLSGPSRRP
jgi:hypothetical protein